MSDIVKNINTIKKSVPEHVRLVAVSKTKPVSDILEAYNAGQRIFGENRVQELLSKKDLLPEDIEWHLIGHLQSNKVKFVVPFVSMIQSVDSYKLLKIINEEAEKNKRVVDCLLQIYIAREETKFGFSMEEITEMAESADFLNMRYVRICGVMGIATFTSNQNQVRNEFDYLSDCFNTLRNKYFHDESCFKEISMGMSDDYKIAVEAGSTLIRVGSLIFGARNKN
ncbi:MAG TPA: YggS family pyridoxal phosphate-dependent enzyme [Bacteroidales bacterium]|nr:YggS family pyridoxal phosphate-dependent enzyme [Bacteroidales bacterium]HPT21498.1 YggS family pyridoxal phosphate-dependent enzyme [Bacteroidales bacterium]